MPTGRRQRIRYQPQQSLFVDPAYTQDGTKLNDNLKHPSRWPAKAQEVHEEDKVTGRGYREKFRNPLHCTQQGCRAVIEDIHDVS
jgi:hypothetical protein